MHSAKIVVSEIERERGVMVGPLLREGVGQSCESSVFHAER